MEIYVVGSIVFFEIVGSIVKIGVPFTASYFSRVLFCFHSRAWLLAFMKSPVLDTLDEALVECFVGYTRFSSSICII